MENPEDKQWAKKYILDPLTAPEPSQETGPGSSFYNVRRSLSMNTKEPESATHRQHRKHNSSGGYPSPPSSASPSRSSFHPSNPFSDTPRYLPLSPEQGPSDRTSRSRSSSLRDSGYQLQESYYPQSPASLGRSKTVHGGRYPPQAHRTQNSSGSARTHSAAPDKGKGLRRSGSLNERYPGDMSHRPLDMLKKDQRTADRAPVRSRAKYSSIDPIDALDVTAVGGAYHHGGPYDATLASRNVNKKYSPLDAVHDSNMEALKATPREYVQDSLIKHVPLQGIATVPPGMTDMGGRVMSYQEGPDLMREPDAGGGAYKRYDFIQYRDDDLKGKGEPSFTIEKALKEHKTQLKRYSGSNAGEYEMQATRYSDGKDGNVKVRQRSVSAAGAGPSSSSRLAPPVSPTTGMSTTSDIRRSNTTGKRLSDGLKRRFGSIRRKRNSDDV